MEHIRALRLFDLAQADSGKPTLQLTESEWAHFHDCEECQLILQVFTRQFNPQKRNGEVNTKFGVYKTVCCGYEIPLAEGMSFPDCPQHPRLPTIWKPAVNADIPRLTAKKPQSGPAGKRMRILIIDNERESISLLIDWLSARGDECLGITNAKHGPAWVSRERCDLVLLDLALSDLNGVSAIPAILTAAPGTKVIMMSRLDEDSWKQKAMHNGAYACLPKPFSLDQLDKILNQVSAERAA